MQLIPLTNRAWEIMTQLEERELQGSSGLALTTSISHLQYAVFLAGWPQPQEELGRTHRLRGGDLTRPWFPNFSWTQGAQQYLGAPLAWEVVPQGL